MAIPPNVTVNFLSDLRGRLKSLSSKKGCDNEESDAITNLLDEIIVRLFDFKKRESDEVPAVNVEVKLYCNIIFLIFSCKLNILSAGNCSNHLGSNPTCRL